MTIKLFILIDLYLVFWKKSGELQYFYSTLRNLLSGGGFSLNFYLYVALIFICTLYPVLAQSLLHHIRGYRSYIVGVFIARFYQETRISIFAAYVFFYEIGYVQLIISEVRKRPAFNCKCGIRSVSLGYSLLIVPVSSGIFPLNTSIFLFQLTWSGSHESAGL